MRLLSPLSCSFMSDIEITAVNDCRRQDRPYGLIIFWIKQCRDFSWLFGTPVRLPNRWSGDVMWRRPNPRALVVQTAPPAADRRPSGRWHSSVVALLVRYYLWRDSGASWPRSLIQPVARGRRISHLHADGTSHGRRAPPTHQGRRQVQKQV